MKKKSFVIFLIISISVLLVDQLSKYFIMINFNEGESIKIINNFFHLTYSHNFGAAFGILQDQTIFLIMVSLIVFIYLIYELIKNINNKFYLISISLIIGGLLGNLIDRLYFGYVRDFLDFYIFGYDFAIFNISDSCIVVGAILLVIGLIKEEKHENKSRRTND